MNRQFASIRELIDHDHKTPLETDHFDTELWDLLCDKIRSPKDLEAYASPVTVYYATRLLQWEVGNGGFAQAAFNIPEWFAAAAEGYEILEKPKAARLIRDAAKLLPLERAELNEKGLFTATIGRLFSHFNESRMAKFNDRIPDDEWEIDEERVGYVRKNRDAFRAVG